MFLGCLVCVCSAFPETQHAVNNHVQAECGLCSLFSPLDLSTFAVVWYLASFSKFIPQSTAKPMQPMDRPIMHEIAHFQNSAKA